MPPRLPGVGTRTWGTFPHPQWFLCFPSADVVNLDLKSTLRVLYNLFTKYKHLE